LKLLIDMNLSPDWLPLLAARGWEAKHWSQLGSGQAPDTELMRWARAEGHVVLTQDLDFSQLLFATRDGGPSVVLLRIENEFDAAARNRVCAALAQAEGALVSGALLTISGNRARLRRLPLVP